MSISSISSSQGFQSQISSSTKSSSMTSEQKVLIEEVLSKYDSSSLSSNDAKEIVQAFQEAGIEPSSALQSAMSASGFDAKEVGDLASAEKTGGGRPMGGPPPPPKEEELSTITELLESLLEEDEESTTTSSTTETLSPYEETSFTSFNTILDYTNQIISLKDDAKNDVMNILDQYNSDESQQDIQKSIVNSLNDILNKPENYNRMSFYA